MTYEEHHAALVTYLKVKVEQADWHGVSDAANDLRVLEAAPPVVRPQDRDQAAFDRIAERIQAEESGRHPSAFWPGVSKPARPSYTPYHEHAVRDPWWKRFLRLLRIAN